MSERKAFFANKFFRQITWTHLVLKIGRSSEHDRSKSRNYIRGHKNIYLESALRM